MSVSCRQTNGDIWVVTSRGRLDQSLNPELERLFTGLLDNGHQRFILDLSEATYINSGGLRCLVTAWRRAREQGGDLVLYGLNNRLDEIFSLVGFDRVFQIYPSYEDAQKHNYP
jgi:anti-sigma B factor antagonist